MDDFNALLEGVKAEATAAAAVKDKPAGDSTPPNGGGKPAGKAAAKPREIRPIVPQLDDDSPAGETKPAAGETKPANVETKPTGDEPPAKPDVHTVTPPAPAKLDAGLVAKAAALGISKEDAQLYGTDERLQKAVDSLQGRIAQAVQDAKKPKPEPFKVKLSKDDYDENVVNAFEEMNTFYQKQLDELRTEVRQMKGDGEKDRDAQEQVAFVGWFDKKVESLGRNYEALLGKGNADALDGKSEHFLNRQSVSKRMNWLEAGYEEDNQPVPDRDRLFEEALASVFYNKLSELARKELVDRLNKRKGLIINKPTHREASDVVIDPEQRAVNEVARKLHAYGHAQASKTSIL